MAFQRLRTRIIERTPRTIRPLLVVAVVVGSMVVAQAAAVAIYYLGGEARSINFRFIGIIGLCMSFAAMAYGFLAPPLRALPRAGRWLLGVAMSVAFWLPTSLAVSRTAIQSTGDVIALALLIVGSGIFVAWLFLPARSNSD
jgi:hypothetical protein